MKMVSSEGSLILQFVFNSRGTNHPQSLIETGLSTEG
jgi:hypothetical protein